MKAVQRHRKTIRQAANKAADFDDPVPERFEKKRGGEAEEEKTVTVAARREMQSGRDSRRYAKEGGERVDVCWWFRRWQRSIYMSAVVRWSWYQCWQRAKVGAGGSLENVVSAAHRRIHSRDLSSSQSYTKRLLLRRASAVNNM